VRRGHTLAAMGQLLDVTPKTISRWEAGTAAPTAANIEALSNTLRFPVSFFFQNELDRRPLEAVSFRALSKTSARLRDSALATSEIAEVVYRWLDTAFNLRTANLPTLPGYDPETAARVVRERWALGDAPIPNLLHLLEFHGVIVMSLERDVESIDAFSYWSGDRPFIFVHQGKTGERQRFDLAHELGHLVMHCEDEHVAGRVAEAQAHRFAAALLMPAADVDRRRLRGAGMPEVIRNKKRWGVSAMALAHRLRELDHLSEWGYRDLCVQLSSAGYRRSEPAGAITPELSQFYPKVLEHLRERGVSSVDLAKELHLNLEELRGYLFGMLPIAMSGQAGGGRSNAHLSLVE
jgi:Zn-dependent peptidase ImmA (M78 family)/DNA-binding XRE family transcriptional regulator